MNSIAGQYWVANPACLLVLYNSTVWSVIEYGGVCFSGMSDYHMRRLERIQLRAGQICFGLMRSIHVLSVEILESLPPIRQRLSFLNEKFLVSGLVNDFLKVRLEELHRIFNNSNCLSELQIVRESMMVSRWYRGRTCLRSSTSTWWI
jgi:hypothetical protein